MKKTIFVSVVLILVQFIANAQNHVGYHIFMPVSNTTKVFEKPYEYHGNTQMSFSLELFYEREKKNKLHHIGFSYQPYSFRYFNSDYFETIIEDYLTLNYIYFKKMELGEIPYYTGSGAMFSILNEQKKYNDKSELEATNKFGDVMKMSMFIEEKIPLSSRTKKLKVNQSINFRFGFDLFAQSRNLAISLPVFFISGGYSMSLTKK